LPIPLYKIHSSDGALSNKRLDLYMRGGIFSVTYKILVLDLLTRRLATSLISGLIVNHATSAKNKGDAFLAELVRKANAGAFVHGFTEKP
jgi:DNA excision repair protein ERCC-4